MINFIRSARGSAASSNQRPTDGGGSGGSRTTTTTTQSINISATNFRQNKTRGQTTPKEIRDERANNARHRTTRTTNAAMTSHHKRMKELDCGDYSNKDGPPLWPEPPKMKAKKPSWVGGSTNEYAIAWQLTKGADGGGESKQNAPRTRVPKNYWHQIQYANKTKTNTKNIHQSCYRKGVLEFQGWTLGIVCQSASMMVSKGSTQHRR